MKDQVLYNFMPSSGSTAVEIISDLAVFFANEGEFEFSEMLFDVLSDAMSNKIKQDIFKEANPVKIENDEFTHEQIYENLRKAIEMLKL